MRRSVLWVSYSSSRETSKEKQCEIVALLTFLIHSNWDGSTTFYLLFVFFTRLDFTLLSKTYFNFRFQLSFPVSFTPFRPPDSHENSLESEKSMNFPWFCLPYTRELLTCCQRDEMVIRMVDWTGMYVLLCRRSTVGRRRSVPLMDFISTRSTTGESRPLTVQERGNTLTLSVYKLLKVS